LIELRRKHPVFRRRRWFQGRSIRGSDLTDIGWFRSDGSPMTDDDWREAPASVLGVFLNGDGIESRDPHGYRVRDDSFYVVFNAEPEQVVFKLPPQIMQERWVLVFDTAEPEFEPPHARAAGTEVTAEPRSVVLLRRT